MMEHDLAISKHAYHVGEYEAGLRSCERLLNMELDNAAALQVKINRVMCMQTLDGLIPVSYTKIDIEPAFKDWSLFNPSLLKRRNGQLLLVIRSSNYKYGDGKYVIPVADRGTIRSKSILCEIDGTLKITSSRILRDPDYVKTEYPVDGLEDARLFELDNTVFVSTTIRNSAPYDGDCRMAVAQINEELDAYTAIQVITPRIIRPEKNWMPITDSDYPRWLYSCGLDNHSSLVHATDNGLILEKHPIQNKVMRLFRGGSQLVKVNEDYFGIIHEVTAVESRLVYSHRFIRTNNEFVITGFSQPFYIKLPRAVEFAAGMMNLGERMIISFGVMDAEAWLAEIKLSDLKQLISSWPLSSCMGKAATG